ncbi:MAG: class I SAM-dependent methyltransferase [Acidobacteriota bacterium]
MATKEDFAKQLLTTFNQGALCLMISVGHRTGLFDTMAKMPPSTSDGIAEAAKLQERYVREWLGAMVTGGVVELDATTGHYSLPEAHAASLTRAAGSDNMARFAQYIPEMGSVESLVVDCFRNGGGVPYEKYARFHEIMAEHGEQFVNAAWESMILPLAPGLAERLRDGIRVLDVGCGRGLKLIRMRELFPNSRFEGVDFSAEAIAFGRETAAARGLSNVALRVADATEPLEKNAYDLVLTLDAIHDQGQPLRVLQNIRQALKPDGVYLMQEIKGSSNHRDNMDHPIGTALYAISCMHCMAVSLAQGGEGLGAMWGEEKTREYLLRAGFTSVEKHELPNDIQNNWYVVRKDPDEQIR